MSKFFTYNIKTLMARTGISAYGLAKQLGINHSTVFRWLDEKTESVPRGRTLVAVASFFGVEPTQLVDAPYDSNEVRINPNPQPLAPKPAPVKVTKGLPIPLAKPCKGLSFAMLFDNDMAIEEGDLVPKAEVWLPPTPVELPHKNQIVAIRAIGEAMAPQICDGDIVYVAFDTEGDVQFKNGDTVLAEPPSDDRNGALPIIRKLVYGDSEKDKWLTTTNPDWPGTKTQRCETLIGKVVAIFRQL